MDEMYDVIFPDDEDIINDLEETNDIEEPADDASIPEEDQDTGQATDITPVVEAPILISDLVEPDKEDVIYAVEENDLTEAEITVEDEPDEPIISNVETLPTIGNVKEGDRVMIALVNGEATVIGTVGAGDDMADELTTISADVADIGIVVAGKADIDDLNAATARIDTIEGNYLTVDSAVIKSLQTNKADVSDLNATNARVGTLETNALTADSAIIKSLQTDKVDTSTLTANYITSNQIAANYAKLDATNITTAAIKEAWVDKLMVQTGLIAHTGTIYTLDAIQLNADRITAGTLDIQRLVVSVEGHKYLVEFNSQGEPVYRKLDGDVIEDLTITADKIVAGAITADKITTANIQGSGGWINLRNGTFNYTNASTGNFITWDGSKLLLNADNIKIGNTDIITVIEDTAPSASITPTASGATITITDKDGTHTATISNGSQGPKGDKGDTGPQGEQGIQGKTGPKGDTGATGPKGDTGATGPQGEQGEKGDKGDTGEQGIQGPKGDTGEKGDKGDTGSQGPQGLKGDTGATGPQGPQGQTGPQGPQGEQGDEGKSAYESAVDGGYTGSENQFNIDLADVSNKAPKTIIREYSGGVLVGKTGNTVGALVNADGSFDITKVSWSGNTPTAGNTLASFGTNTIIGEKSAGKTRLKLSSTGFDFILNNSAGDDINFGHIGKDSSDNCYYSFGNTWDNITRGNYSFAEGFHPTAEGYASHAEGDTTTATGTGSHSEGHNTTAGGTGSHAEGWGTTVSNTAAHAEGSDTVASGSYSHAEGTNTIASGAGAHAEGYHSEATAMYSHAQNYGTIAGYSHQTAIGKYNDNKSTSVFEVGWGSSSSSRSNVLELNTNGNLDISGSYTMGGSKLLKVVATTKSSIKVSKTTTGNGTFTVSSQSGYTPVGMVGFDMSGTGLSNSVPLQIQLSGSTIAWQIRNNGSSTTDLSLQVFILYAKTGLI